MHYNGRTCLSMQAHRQEKVIVYMLTCACVDFWASALPHVPEAQGLSIHALHGRMKQRVRDAKLGAFTSSAAGMGVVSYPIYLVPALLDHA